MIYFCIHRNYYYSMSKRPRVKEPLDYWIEQWDREVRYGFPPKAPPRPLTFKERFNIDIKSVPYWYEREISQKLSLVTRYIEISRQVQLILPVRTNVDLWCGKLYPASKEQRKGIWWSPKGYFSVFNDIEELYSEVQRGCSEKILQALVQAGCDDLAKQLVALKVRKEDWKMAKALNMDDD